MCVVHKVNLQKFIFKFIFDSEIQKRQVVLFAHEEQCQNDSCLFCFFTSRTNLMLNFCRFYLTSYVYLFIF
uniref:Uncharacterized protein n=1 Tax=Arundo donax TaxID=35708 RepID=A0A0A9BB03_ARUDO